MTKTLTVGALSALPDQRELDGFIYGVHTVNPDVEVLSEVVGDWWNREKARELANRLIENGADILIGFGDAFGIEVIDAARNHNIYAIGYLTDQSFIARDTVLYSVTQNVERIYMDTVRTLTRNPDLLHEYSTLGFHNQYQDIIAFNTYVPKEVQHKIKEMLQKYKEGKLKIPINNM